MYPTSYAGGFASSRDLGYLELFHNKNETMLNRDLKIDTNRLLGSWNRADITTKEDTSPIGFVVVYSGTDQPYYWEGAQRIQVIDDRIRGLAGNIAIITVPQLTDMPWIPVIGTRYRPTAIPGIVRPIQLTHNAAGFMEINNLTSFVMQSIEMITSSLDNENCVYREPVIELARDIEAPEWRALKIIVEIENRPYSEILDVWNRVSRSFYEGLNKEIAKKIYVIMKRKKNSQEKRWGNF